jgi:hypothetical protein
MNTEEAIQHFANYALPELRKIDNSVRINHIDALYEKWKKDNKFNAENDIHLILYGFIRQYLDTEVNPLDYDASKGSVIYKIK